MTEFHPLFAMTQRQLSEPNVLLNGVASIKSLSGTTSAAREDPNSSSENRGFLTKSVGFYGSAD